MPPHAPPTTTASHEVSPSMRPPLPTPTHTPTDPCPHPHPTPLQAALAPVTVELWGSPIWSCSMPPCRDDAQANPNPNPNPNQARSTAASC